MGRLNEVRFTGVTLLVLVSKQILGGIILNTMHC